MSENIKICIYCLSNDTANFKGVEHVIPQAFGTFGSATPTLDCVCDSCNSYFGKNHDLYLARETIEGIVRYNNGILSSEARAQKHLHITLDEGPEVGQFAVMKVAIDGTTIELMAPKSQFQILNQKTKNMEVYFKDQLAGLKLPEDIYGKPGDNTVKGTWMYNIFAFSKEEHDEIVTTLNANGIMFVAGEPFIIPSPGEADADGKYTVPLKIEGEVTFEHRQAHAKILFNFIARYLGYEEVTKPQWDFLRQYARFAEGKIKYRMAEHSFPAPEKESNAVQMICSGIIIQIHNMNGHVLGNIRFYGNQTYQYILCENVSISDEQQIGYLFINGKEPFLLAADKNVVEKAGLPNTH